MIARLCATGHYYPADFADLHSCGPLTTASPRPPSGSACRQLLQHAIGDSPLDRIRVPVLLIHAKDDTFVPWQIVEHAAVRANPQIETLVTEHGGHLGFIARGNPRFWLDAAIMEWIEGQ